jgi:glycosyltransferase involved in cell wall biosynthesis
MGDAAEGYVDLLHSLGVDVRWTPLVWERGTIQVSEAPISAEVAVVHSTPVWLSELATAPRRLAVTTYEADRLPDADVEVLSQFTGVAVPSALDAATFRGSGVRVPVAVVPHVSALPVGPEVRSSDPIELDPARTTFCTVGTWTARKATADTIEAYLRAFTGADAVELVVKTTLEDRVALERIRRSGGDPAQAASWRSLARLLARHPAPPAVRLVTRTVSRAALAELLRDADCFVALSRGEGWNLPAFDAARAGTPVIATGWGGHLDYLPPGYPYLVAHEMVPTTGDEPDDWFVPHPDQRWARADIDDAARLLRSVHEDRVGAARWGASAQASAVAAGDPGRVGPLLLAALGL